MLIKRVSHVPIEFFLRNLDISQMIRDEIEIFECKCK